MRIVGVSLIERASQILLNKTSFHIWSLILHDSASRYIWRIWESIIWEIILRELFWKELFACDFVVYPSVNLVILNIKAHKQLINIWSSICISLAILSFTILSFDHVAMHVLANLHKPSLPGQKLRLMHQSRDSIHLNQALDVLLPEQLLPRILYLPVLLTPFLLLKAATEHAEQVSTIVCFESSATLHLCPQNVIVAIVSMNWCFTLFSIELSNECHMRAKPLVAVH